MSPKGVLILLVALVQYVASDKIMHAWDCPTVACNNQEGQGTCGGWEYLHSGDCKGSARYYCDEGLQVRQVRYAEPGCGGERLGAASLISQCTGQEGLYYAWLCYPAGDAEPSPEPSPVAESLLKLQKAWELNQKKEEAKRILKLVQMQEDKLNGRAATNTSNTAAADERKKASTWHTRLAAKAASKAKATHAKAPAKKAAAKPVKAKASAKVPIAPSAPAPMNVTKNAPVLAHHVQTKKPVIDEEGKELDEEQVKLKAEADLRQLKSTLAHREEQIEDIREKEVTHEESKSELQTEKLHLLKQVKAEVDAYKKDMKSMTPAHRESLIEAVKAAKSTDEKEEDADEKADADAPGSEPVLFENFEEQTPAELTLAEQLKEIADEQREELVGHSSHKHHHKSKKSKRRRHKKNALKSS